ncbi:MAG: SpoIID/LytB domain-containing protein [Angustibacter sp.]
MMRAGGRRRLTRGAVALAGVALAGTTLVATGAPAQAAEVVVRPAGGLLQVSGHGYGHGRGLSQWGAYGAALKGLTFQQILAFYYPGTTLGSLADAPITVRVTSDTDGATEVQAQDGLTASSGTRTLVLPTSPYIPRWRVTSANGYHLQYFSVSSGNIWRDYDLMGSKAPIPGPVTFSRSAGTVRLLMPGSFYREYIGSVVAASYSGVHSSVVRTTMETYLRGVVPNEMPASWSTEALRAQAVAARSYAANQRASSPTSRPYQTCDSTQCQVFDGSADYTLTGTLKTRHTDPRSDAAITAAVSGTGAPAVVMYGSSIAFTEFSASNGGYTTAGSVPYLVAKPDPYDGVAGGGAHSWNDSVSVTTIERANPTIGRLVSLSVTRDGHGEWGGRIDTVTLVGTSGRVTISGTQFAAQAGFLHRWWAPRFADPVRDLTSDGANDLVARVASTGQLRVYRGSGGRFGSPVLSGPGWNGMTVVQGSFDYTGDGLVDLVAVERSTGYLLIYPGRGDGHFSSAIRVGHGWNTLRNVTAVGDLSGDGLPDLVGVASDGRLVLYPGNGHSGVLSGRTAGTGWSGFDKLVGVGDVDGDGHDDLMGRVLSTGQLAFYHGTGTGGFRGGRDVTTGGWNAMTLIAAAGDLDGDGHPDLVAVEKATGILWRYAGTTTGVGARTQIGTGWNSINALG